MQYSIINFSEAKRDKRFDSEFLNKKVIINKLLTKHKYVNLGSISYITDGEHGSPEYDENGYICLTGKNVKDFYIDLSNIYKISENQFKKNSRVLVKRGNILIGIVGTIGNSTLIMEDINAITSRHLATIKCKDNYNDFNISKSYIVTFLNSKYGKEQSILYSAGNVQPLINLTNISKFLIPIFSNEFQKSIEKLVLEAHNQRQISNSLMKEANEILEKEIGFDKLEIKKKKVNYSIVNYSETLLSKRIDAEYYQEKYKIIMDKIQSYKNGYKKINDVCDIYKNVKLKIDKEKKYDYVEIGSVNISNGGIEPTSLYGDDLPANAKRILKVNDIIISKVRPYRGAISLVDNDYIGSSAFTVLKEKDIINKETIFIFFRNNFMLNYINKFSTGTSYPVIVDEYIYNTYIPIIDKNVQNIIADKVKEAYKSRDKAKALLEEAKKKVEDAIENGE
ncbi:hypothetical protein [uncultured Brachyspira sp.]|uniref:restriction endonuclease subunit S n=1 Tax=uncultured Brachyspira sp. TaxID=221953 RepID=UPI0025CFB130|nr:hypothetical protein [uncultured Brachyspira sp.]